MAGARDQRRSDEERLDKMLREGNWEESPESLDSETARILFDMACDSLDRTVRMLDDMVAGNRHFHEEFAARSREIAAVQASIDQRLQKLIGE